MTLKLRSVALSFCLISGLLTACGGGSSGESTETVVNGDCGTCTGVVSTFAGSSQGFAEGTGTAARFDTPTGVAVDTAGNVYVADSANNRIRKITSGGVVTTLAGGSDANGKTAGFVDGTGSGAQFYAPSSVAVDRAGNVYVADSYNDRIRKVTPDGVVTTLAGGSDAEGETRGFVDGTGSDARFDTPYGVAVDGDGNVYVADTGNNSIRKITPAGEVTTLAGSETAGFVNGTGTAAQFDLPYGVAVDSGGNVYVADLYYSSLRKVTPEGVVTTLAGNGNAGFANGTGSAAMFYGIMDVAVDAAGNVYAVDYFNARIRKITAAGVVTTYAGNGVSGYANGTGSAVQFFGARSLAVDSAGVMYVAEADNDRIRKITP